MDVGLPRQRGRGRRRGLQRPGGRRRPRDPGPGRHRRATTARSPAAGGGLQLADRARRPISRRCIEPMLARETNRHRGTPAPLTERRRDGADMPRRSAEGGTAAAADRAATTSNAPRPFWPRSDRIRYLTPRLHAEMISELRWPERRITATGIDVRSLELVGQPIWPPSTSCAEPTSWPNWRTGTPARPSAHDTATGSAAVRRSPSVIDRRQHSDRLRPRRRRPSRRVWIAAQQHGLAVQPVSPVFLYAHDDARPGRAASPTTRRHCARLQRAVPRADRHSSPTKSQVLVLRFADAPRPSVRSRRGEPDTR